MHIKLSGPQWAPHMLAVIPTIERGLHLLPSEWKEKTELDQWDHIQLIIRILGGAS